jgi:hypothetical protein
MIKRILPLLLTALMVFCAADSTQARGSSGGYGSSRESRSSSRSGSGGFERACKSESCFKKHPSGHYFVPTGKKRKK